MSICDPITYDSIDKEYIILEKQITKNTTEINTIYNKLVKQRNDAIIIYYMFVCTYMVVSKCIYLLNIYLQFLIFLSTYNVVLKK